MNRDRRKRDLYDGTGKMALHEVKLCLLGVSVPRWPRSALCRLTGPLPLQESGVGKTCIVNRFVSDVFSEHESLTVG